MRSAPAFNVLLAASCRDAVDKGSCDALAAVALVCAVGMTSEKGVPWMAAASACLSL